MIQVTEDHPDHAIDLLEASVAYIRSLYPEECDHSYDINKLTSDGSRFFIARHNGAPVGCGAFVWRDGSQVEIKHMFVSASSRGLGCGRSILSAIEQHARWDNAERIVLETSLKQTDAIALYASFGYEDCEPYTDHHAEDVFMMKVLSNELYVTAEASLDLISETKADSLELQPEIP